MMPAASTSPPVHLVIISGRSGSGKSVALRTAEDLGFYCIDNLPVSFMHSLLSESKERFPRLAVSIDIRNLPGNSETLMSLCRELRGNTDLDTTLIYVDADDQILLRRYLQSRRMHPLTSQGLTLAQAIELESSILSDIASIADLRLDTSALSVHEFSNRMAAVLSGHKEKKLVVICESFGFKHGIAKDADFVFDSRFLPNPYWEQELRPHTGLDPQIQEYFSRHAEVGIYVSNIEHLLFEQMDMIRKSSRSYLTVAIGCTGGRHRSVYIAQKLGERFRSRGLDVLIRHRALELDLH